MQKITDISEAFKPMNAIKNALKPGTGTKEEQSDVIYDPPDPEWKEELREVEDKFNHHDKHVNLGVLDTSTNKIANATGQMKIGVTRSKDEQHFTIYIITTYNVFKMMIDKNGAEIFKAKNVVMPANTIEYILDAIQDIDNFTGWKTYDNTIHTIITRDLKLEPVVKTTH